MKNTIITIAISLLSAFLGYQAHTPPPCPICDFNITGEIKELPTNLLSPNKHKVSIYFNGIEVMQGFLSTENEANLIGSYKDKKATAQCSGAEIINCQISYNNKETTLKFNKAK